MKKIIAIPINPQCTDNVSPVLERAKNGGTSQWHSQYLNKSRLGKSFLPLRSVLGEKRRWWKSKTRRSPSSPHIHQKYIYTWNCSYRTPTERWQKTSDLPKGKKLPTYLGRAKDKRNNRDKRIGTGITPVGGSCEGRKVSTH